MRTARPKPELKRPEGQRAWRLSAPICGWESCENQESQWRPWRAWETTRAAATKRVMDRAKMWAPRMGLATRSTAALRRRSWARHQRTPGAGRLAWAAVQARERWKAWVTRSRSAQERQAPRWARSSGVQAWGQCPRES